MTALPVRPSVNETITFTYTVQPEDWQVNAPANFVGAWWGDHRLFEGGVVLNSSNAQLTQIRIGVSVTGVYNGNPAPQPFQILVSPPISVSIPGKDIGAVGPRPWYLKNVFEAAEAAGVTDIVANVGVVNAKFSNPRKSVQGQ
jgi:hypothetical protein